MEFELTPDTADNETPPGSPLGGRSNYRLSSSPIVNRTYPEEDLDRASDLPRSYGTKTLCLMARDPHTIFAYWDIDWPSAFREQPPAHHKVYLRLLNSEGLELSSTEIEPMAGNCSLTVSAGDTAYRGELGYAHPAQGWNQLATSEVITTPSDTISADSEADFATVPFHLSFQHMIDLLRVTKEENTNLTGMLVHLRSRAASANDKANLSIEERGLAQVIEEAESSSRSDDHSGSSDFWTVKRIQRIFSVSGSSPSEGFSGTDQTSKENPYPGGLGGSSRTR